MPRFHCPALLATGSELDLPASAARHVQVLRLQPGDAITLFDGGLLPGSPGGEFEATVVHMGRSDVRVRVGTHHAIDREAPRAVHLLAGITANERMDWLVEKATELGVASITPLMAERSVLKLKGERADKKIAHWQAVAISAAEQCGRNRVPLVHPAVDLAGWVRHHGAAAGSDAVGTTAPPQRLLLSLRAGTVSLHTAVTGHGGRAVLFLSGPEGGLSPAEEALAAEHGFAPVTLGPRVLRAETAPLAALAALVLT
ncbi:16S rRNA (uracil(1498)-N(3))-methyltransferase [Acidovorax sp. RAC01]|uniref:16S rRNA (uracil(1498)-N(3))-methyltransferase n=1 Tax=Acidovorax sp. RAC01 TaxID=1842533 RepID=UPI00083E7A35|nr:16S rRNA (uracil(1498)-N(3))-methyltransferase [Acidovorax sp. RAC01]AOG23281.1 RNA methyltransferase, RsmE family protein [Acidovorax sp. RAC01]